MTRAQAISKRSATAAAGQCPCARGRRVAGSNTARAQGHLTGGAWATGGQRISARARCYEQAALALKVPAARAQGDRARKAAAVPERPGPSGRSARQPHRRAWHAPFPRAWSGRAPGGSHRRCPPARSRRTRSPTGGCCRAKEGVRMGLGFSDQPLTLLYCTRSAPDRRIKINGSDLTGIRVCGQLGRTRPVAPLTGRADLLGLRGTELSCAFWAAQM